MMLSRIIADLLSPKGDHAQGINFLKLFLSQLSNAPTYNHLDLLSTKVSTEVITFKNETLRRMDIYIEIPFLDKSSTFGICIENNALCCRSKGPIERLCCRTV